MHLYQHPKWPHFHFDLERIADPLAQVRHLQGWLLGRVTDWGMQTKLESSVTTTVAEIVSNSLIEGEELPADEVRSSVAQRLGLPTAGLITPTHHIDGVVEMMLNATQRYDEVVTEDRLFGWHAALFPTGRSGMAKIIVGAYRDHPDTEPMQVISGQWTRTRVHFEAPSSTVLKREMQQLLDYINAPDGTDGLLRAGIVHLWFLTLHPFDDGNGRMARALTDLMLARSDQSRQRFYSISSTILQRRKYYYRQLETAQKGSLDITNWLLWFLDTVADAINTANDQLSDVFAQARFWRKHQDTVLNTRQKMIIAKLWEGYQGKLTSFRYANLCSVSKDTAVRDINDLVAKGILKKGAAGGRATAYVLIREVPD